MPTILSLNGHKGGIGKSTIALALAVEWHLRGIRVLLVDADDEQRTAFTWADVADELERNVPPVISIGDTLRSKLPSLAAPYELVIVDTPGRNGRRSTYALGHADLAILPCGPTGPEMWAMAATVAQVRDVQALRPELDAAILITRKQPNTVIGRVARKALEGAHELDGLDVLETELEYRVTHGEAIGAGMGPTTYAPASDAAAEIRALANELEQRLGLGLNSKRSLKRKVIRHA